MRIAGVRMSGGEPEFEQLIAQVVGFIEAPAIGLDLPLDVRGTAFQQRVWAALREIPAGKTLALVSLDAQPRVVAPPSSDRTSRLS